MNAFLRTCCRRWVSSAGHTTAFSFTRNPAGLRTPLFRQLAATRSGFSTSGLRISFASCLAKVSQARTPLSDYLLLFSRSGRQRVRDYYGRDARSSGSPGGGRPPSSWLQNLMRRIDSTPSYVITYTIIGINVAVYLMWQAGIQNYNRFRDPDILNFMMKNFTSSLNNLQQGRIWTLVTSAFSQSSTAHAFMNILVLYFASDSIQSVLGGSRFLGVYLTGGIVASLVSSLWWGKGAHSNGASGALYSVFTLYACMFPTAQFLLFFIVPVPAWLCLGGLFCWDLYGMLGTKHGMADSAGHVGGIVTGALLYYFRFRRFF